MPPFKPPSAPDELIRFDIEQVARDALEQSMKNPRGRDWFSRMQIDPLHLLATRLRRIPEPGAMINWTPLDHLAVFIGDNKAFVTYIKDDHAVTLEDDAALFPSDILLAQLKLVMGI
jgi:hypothetical protein